METQMAYLVKLGDGSTITVHGQIDAESFTAELNSSVQFLNIGGSIIQKHLIQMIVPITESTTIQP